MVDPDQGTSRVGAAGRVRREHTVVYNRLVESGELENSLVEKPSRPMTIGSQILGFTLMALGLIILVLILTGFITSLTGGRGQRTGGGEAPAPSLAQCGLR